MSFLQAFCRFWYDLVIGDDWKIAIGVVAALALTLAALATGVVGAGAATVVGAVLVAVTFTVDMVIDVWRDR